MKLYKGLFSFIICVVFLLGFAPDIQAESENIGSFDFESAVLEATERGHRYAYMKFSGSKIVCENASISYYGTFKKIRHKGRYGFNNPDDENTNYFIDIADDYWTSDVPARVAITIEYADLADSSLSVMPRVKSVGGKNAVGITNYDIYTTGGSGEWKTTTIYLDNFVPSSGSTDVRVRGCGFNAAFYGRTDSAIIGGIFIEEDNTEYDVEVEASNGFTGRIFDYGNSKNMKLTVENNSDTSSKTSLSYTVTDYYGETVFENTLDEIELAAGETKVFDVSTKAEECGTYIMSVTLDNKMGDYTESYTRNFDFSIAHTFNEDDERNSLLGIVGHYDDMGYMGEISVDQTMRLPFSSVRSGGTWKEHETALGVYNEPLLQAEVRERVLEYGGTMQYIHMDIPSFIPTYNGVKYFTESEEMLTAYAKAAAHFASLEGVTELELWNEPNHSGFLTSKNGGAYFATIAKYVYPAVKSVNPNMKVVVGSLAGFDINWMLAFLMAGGLEYCDAVSYHPYQYDSWSVGTFKSQIARIQQEMMNVYGYKKPVIISEMGVTSCYDENGEKVYGIDKELHPQAVAQIYLAAQHDGGVEKVYYYNFVATTTEGREREGGWALVNNRMNFHNAYTARPAFVSLAAYGKLFTGYTGGRDLSDENYNTCIFEYTKENSESMAALWTNKESETVTLNLGCGKVTVYDFFGNVKDVKYSENGIYTFLISDENIYLKGDFTEFELCEAVYNDALFYYDFENWTSSNLKKLYSDAVIANGGFRVWTMDGIVEGVNGGKALTPAYISAGNATRTLEYYFNPQLQGETYLIEFDFKKGLAAEELKFSARKTKSGTEKVIISDSDFDKIPDEWVHVSMNVNMSWGIYTVNVSDSGGESLVKKTGLLNLGTTLPMVQWSITRGSTSWSAENSPKIDNFTAKNIYGEAAKLDDDNVCLYSKGVLQKKNNASPEIDRIVIDFEQNMNRETMNGEHIFVTKKGDTTPLKSYVFYADGIYTIHLEELLESGESYVLYVNDVKNVSDIESENTSWEFNIMEHRLGVDIISITQNGKEVEDVSLLTTGNAQMQIRVSNGTKNESTVWVIVAYYIDDTLVDSDILSVDIARFKETDESMNITVPKDIKDIKLFTWEKNSIKPLK